MLCEATDSELDLRKLKTSSMNVFDEEEGITSLK